MGTFAENVPIFKLKHKTGTPGRTFRVNASIAPRLLAYDMAKSYGATVALEDVSLQLVPGQIHALLGENGAGKSTLVKILSGVTRANRGAMQIEGHPYNPASILDAREAGVATAFQELSLPPNLMVSQALLLPNLRKGPFGLVSQSSCDQAASEILKKYRISDLSPRDEISQLTLAQRQRLEIARAMSHATSLLILDEPTAALTDVNWLFSLVREQTAAGLSVLYISHRLAEVRELCSSATVLRNGRSVADVDLSIASDADIFRMMVGRSEGSVRPAAINNISEMPITLELDHLKGSKLKGVSLKLRKGEILGVAGLEGQGQRELFRALVGLEIINSGTIKVNGVETELKSPRSALEAGLAFIPEERKVDGIFPSLSTAGNVVLPILSRLSKSGLIWPSQENKSASVKAESVELSFRYLDFLISDLSGGNQQKALLARALITEAPTLLLYDPTRGVDVGTKEAIYAAIRAYAENGGAVLLYSSELPELVRLADRCVVIYGGKVFSEFSGDEIQEESLVAALTGHRGDQSVAHNRSVA